MTTTSYPGSYVRLPPAPYPHPHLHPHVRNNVFFF